VAGEIKDPSASEFHRVVSEIRLGRSIDDAMVEMADRVGVISKGQLIAIDEKKALMARMGRKTLKITLNDPVDAVPAGLEVWDLRLEDDGHQLCYAFDSNAERTGIASLMKALGDLHIGYKDLSTNQSSLEDIFVELVHTPGQAA